jgi:hypothetical protein
MIANLEPLHSDNQIEVSNLDVVVDPAFAGVDDADANAHALTDLVTKKQTIAGTLQKRRHKRDAREHSQSRFA